jgi:hypothetical protein
MRLSALHHAPLGVGTVRRPAPTTQMQSAIGFRARSCAEAWTLRNCEAIHAIEAVVSMYGLRMQANLMDGSMISKRTSAATVYSSC